MRLAFPFLAAIFALPAGAQVTNDSFRVFTIHAPPEIARTDTINGQSIDWGGQPPPQGISGRLVHVRDSQGSELGCSPLVNAGDVDGQIALIRRGVCAFSAKAYWAERAGALAFVVYQDDRVPDDDCSSVFMDGIDTSVVLIPGGFLPRCVAVEIVPTVASGAEVMATMAPLIVVGTEEGSESRGVALDPPVPNPARGETTLTLSLARYGFVRADAVDGLGRRLVVLHDGPLPAGTHRLTFDVSALSPGAYTVRIVLDGRAATQRVVVVR